MHSAQEIDENLAYTFDAYSNLLCYCSAQWPGYKTPKHIRMIAEHLEKIERGIISRLIITVPPRHGKTCLVSENFVPWYFGRNPEREVIFSTYSGDRADDVGRKVRNQMIGDLHSIVFPDCHISVDSASIKKFSTKQKGEYHAVGVGGAITGRGANLFLIDDPIKGREEAESPTIRTKLKDWYKSVAYTRLMPENAIIIIACITGDTPILMGNGSWKKIEDIKINETVMSYKNGKHVIRRVKNQGCQGEDEVYKIILPNHTIEGNKDHPFLVKIDDDKYEWIKLEKLHRGQKIVVSRKINFRRGKKISKDETANDEFMLAKIQKIEHTGKKLVYNLEIEETENFIADGIVTHNTRWHNDDLVGWLLREHTHEDWTVIDFPAMAMKDDDILGRKIGDALWEDRFPKVRLKKIKMTIGTRDWSALYQQRPILAEGGIININWFKHYENRIPDRITLKVQSWDTGSKKSITNTPSVCTTWIVTKNAYYLWHVFRKKMEYPELKKATVILASKFDPDVVLIEDKSSGTALIQDLKHETKIPIIAITPVTDKITRMSSESAKIESGKVFLPTEAPWLVDYEMEMGLFPYGTMDQADSTSQFLNWTAKKKWRQRVGLERFYK